MRKIQVPYIDQSIKYPTGCESVSAVMLLKYLGYEITVDEFIQNCLECREMEIRDGVLYGPDPNKFFCGSPYDEDSFGIYAKGLLKALEKAAGKDFQFTDESGTPIQKLLEKYIDQGMPVVFWATLDFTPVPEERDHWLLADGTDFAWKCHEHCLLLVGYDEENYWFNDPWHDHGVCAQPKELVERCHAAQDSYAVTLRRK